VLSLQVYISTGRALLSCVCTCMPLMSPHQCSICAPLTYQEKRCHLHHRSPLFPYLEQNLTPFLELGLHLVVAIGLGVRYNSRGEESFRVSGYGE
jgi:hypothetical protein